MTPFEEQETARWLEGRELTRRAIEQRLARFRIKEKLLELRDRVWKVGEVRPIAGFGQRLILDSHKNDPDFAHPYHQIAVVGYCLVYSYPAPVPHDIERPSSLIEGVRSDAFAINVDEGVYIDLITRFPGKISTDPKDIPDNPGAPYWQITRGEPYPWDVPLEADTVHVFKRFGGADPYTTSEYKRDLEPFQFGADGSKHAPWLRITPTDLDHLLANYADYLVASGRLPRQSADAMQRRMEIARQDGSLKSLPFGTPALEKILDDPFEDDLLLNDNQQVESAGGRPEGSMNGAYQVKLIVFESKPDDPCLPIGIVIPVPLAKVKEALVDMFRSAPELTGHRMVNVKDQPGDFFYYEVASTEGDQFLAKGILMDDHSGGTDVRIDNRQPPHDTCSASQKATVAQLTTILFEILVSRGHAPQSDLAQLEQLNLYVDAASPSHSVGADLLAQLQRITNDMVSGRKREAQALGEAETLGARAGRGAIEELAKTLAGSLQVTLVEQPHEREKTFRLAELALNTARGANDRSAALTLAAALGRAANATHEFRRSVTYFKFATDLSQAMGQKETAEAMRREHAEALRRVRGE